MPPLRVGILGYGTVGSAVADRLTSDVPANRVVLTHILDRRAGEKRCRNPRLALLPWTTDIDAILTTDVDVVVETIGGSDPAGEWIRRALLSGKSVVTANKELMAARGVELLRLAERQGRQLRFEAAVGGALPIVRAVSEGLAGDELTRIVAILNGTTNFILSRIEATGCTFAEALTEAERCGYAERDVSADVDGRDAAAKLAILCAIGFGLQVRADTIPRLTAAHIGAADFERARLRGSTIRQLASAEFDRGSATLTARVQPQYVTLDSIFGRTIGVGNAAIITGRHAGDVGLFGPGAGGSATAVAIISDLLAIARDKAAVVPAPATHSKFQIPNSKFIPAEATC